ncbi:FAD-dependent oxidoreductase [Corynebacterium terpenotabidum]|uniref:Pyridine nucleotide-disulfide oxidoreductase n=1 Tax=Corynebacterium terpenotabidum Y-11 TaxID=1200352 RepID=S4XF41_9CORY|nr:FAD-dependent oxidoreductase [Corynebacterium terpenotabidum]AGP31757.1 pyridine nucleotide-disulfide oxidoreductase [Corynebacterium terpenotabidum Y-11]
MTDQTHSPRHTVIVGGVAGGMSAATRLRRRDEHARITVLEKSGHVSFANCGLPYYIGGVIEGRENLLLQTPASLHERFNLDVHVNTEVTAIDRAAHELTVTDLTTGQQRTIGYDTLVLSPGAAPFIPPVPGIERALALRTVEDTDRIHDAVAGLAPGAPVVVAGGGFIGIEVAENLAHRGLDVTVVEFGPQIMGPLDPEIAGIVERRLVDNGVHVLTGTGVATVEDVTVTLTDGTSRPADLVIAAAGVRPATGFAAEAGLETLAGGALVVDATWRTSDPDIFAVGDAVATPDALTGEPVVVPLAQTANRDGRLVADIISGDDVSLPRTWGTSVMGVFGLQVASTGWTEKRLVAAGVPHQVIATHPASHAGYYPGAAGLSMKLLVGTGDFRGEDLRDRILGAQVVGEEGADKRLDILATAMQSGRRASELLDLELAYAPQFSSAKDPVNMLGYIADNLRTGRTELVTWNQIDELAQDAVLLDVRTPGEFAAGSLPGAVNIPLDELRGRLGEVRELCGEAPVVVFCQVGQRGHVAESVLRGEGLTRVYNLTGGYRTWSDGQRTLR